MKLTKFLTFSMLLVLALSAGNLFAQKMTAEEVLAKHLDSIGSAQSRDAVKTRIIVSDVEFLRQRLNPIQGKSIIASTNEGVMFGINLDAVDYRLDKFSYDGEKVRVGYIQPGIRSILGNFILSYDSILKDGLLGGTLSSSWALLNAKGGQFKLSYDGTEKIEGMETHVLEFQPKGGSDLTVKMYFESKNFRHIRTTYNRIIGARMAGNVDGSGRQPESRYRIVEDFSNFKKFGQLTLPSAYKIDYTFGGAGATNNFLWKLKVTDASFNQALGDNAFDIDAN
jgi:hypothetical protein